MIEFDSNGIAIDASGKRIYKRYAEILLDGKRVMSGIYIGQSTQGALLVEPFKLAAYEEVNGRMAEVWTQTDTVVTVRPSDIINIFEPRDRPFESIGYAEYDAPFDDVDTLARFIIDPENKALLFQALRLEINKQVNQPVSEKGYSWEPTVVGVVRGMPQARRLFENLELSYDQICMASKILDRAVAILRGAA